MTAQQPRVVLIADDHPVFRSALRLSVLKLLPGTEIREAESFDSLRSAARRGAELALLDLMMPGADGFSSLLYLRDQHPQMRVAVCSGIEQPLCMRAALALGAIAYIPKTLSPESIVDVLRAVLAGESWFPPGVAEGEAATIEQKLASRVDMLSPQELRVLLTLGDGRMNKEIAEALGIREGTVKVHMKAILRKLQVSTRTQAALIAREMLNAAPPSLLE